MDCLLFSLSYIVVYFAGVSPFCDALCENLTEKMCYINKPLTTPISGHNVVPLWCKCISLLLFANKEEFECIPRSLWLWQCSKLFDVTQSAWLDLIACDIKSSEYFGGKCEETSVSEKFTYPGCTCEGKELQLQKLKSLFEVILIFQFPCLSAADVITIRPTNLWV